MLAILYDTKENKYKVVVDILRSNTGLTWYKTDDGCLYGVGKLSHYTFITLKDAVKILNSMNK